MRIHYFLICWALIWNLGHSQALEAINNPTARQQFQHFSAVLFNGEILAAEGVADGALEVPQGRFGKFTVAAVDRTNLKKTILHPIGFKVAVKNYHANTLWMYSDDILYELDLQEVLDRLEAGDRLIFMAVDKNYRLPRYEVVVHAGC